METSAVAKPKSQVPVGVRGLVGAVKPAPGCPDMYSIDGVQSTLKW